MTRTILFLALLTGCASASSGSNEELLAEYENAVAAIHELADGYVADSAQSTDTASITTLQTNYESAIVQAVDDIEHVLEDLEGCGMMDAGTSRLDEAQTSLQTITGDLNTMMQTHSEHTDVADCIDTAESHELVVDGEVAAMEEHHDAWHDMDMSCEGHGDDGHAE